MNKVTTAVGGKEMRVSVLVTGTLHDSVSITAQFDHDVGDVAVANLDHMFEAHVKAAWEEGWGDPPPDLFWFSRLLVKNQGQGRGKFFLPYACELFDTWGISVFNAVNPYGILDKKQLIKFFIKYGNFEPLNDEGILLRRPTKRKPNTTKRVKQWRKVLRY